MTVTHNYGTEYNHQYRRVKIWKRVGQIKTGDELVILTGDRLVWGRLVPDHNDHLMACHKLSEWETHPLDLVNIDKYLKGWFSHIGIIKTGKRASYQPNISDCTHAARLLSSHCSPFVSPQYKAAQPRDWRIAPLPHSHTTNTPDELIIPLYHNCIKNFINIRMYACILGLFTWHMASTLVSLKCNWRAWRFSALFHNE